MGDNDTPVATRRVEDRIQASMGRLETKLDGLTTSLTNLTVSVEVLKTEVVDVKALEGRVLELEKAKAKFVGAMAAVTFLSGGAGAVLAKLLWG